MNRFEAELRNKHMTVIARIDHAAAATQQVCLCGLPIS